MQQRGISPMELQKRTGLSLATIRRLRKTQPQQVDLRVVEAICRALAVGIDELLVLTTEGTDAGTAA
jgi:DNA-binding Xre family transcriptional regulator